MASKAILLTTADVVADQHGAFNAWYDGQHAPELVACPGFHGVTRYRCLNGEPDFMAIFEIDGLQALQTEEFRAVAGFGPMTPHVRSMSGRVFEPIFRLDGARQDG